MKVKKVVQRLRNESKIDTTWITKAKWRSENEAYLDECFDMATKLLLKLRENRENNIYPRNYDELSTYTNVSKNKIKQYVKGNFKDQDFHLIIEKLNLQKQ